MKPIVLILGAVGSLCLVAAGLQAKDTSSDEKAKGDPRAAALMEQAAKTRYVWSPDVSAVSGKFTWQYDGKSGAGTFRSELRKKGGLQFTADGNTEIPEEVKDHIGSLISHRTPAAPGAAPRPTPPYVVLVEDEDRGPLIMTVGDKMQSTQRVKDGKMVQVNRLMMGKRFTIDVTEFDKSSDGRFISSAFTVTWWDPATGKRTELDKHTTQGLDSIDGQMFPKAERVVSDKDGKETTLEVHYSDIKFDKGN